MPRLIEIRDNLKARIAEADHYGWLGEIAGLQVSLTAAEQKLDAMRQLADRHPTTHLGMPDFRSTVGRATDESMPHKSCAPTGRERGGRPGGRRARSGRT